MYLGAINLRADKHYVNNKGSARRPRLRRGSGSLQRFSNLEYNDLTTQTRAVPKLLGIQYTQ